MERQAQQRYSDDLERWPHYRMGTEETGYEAKYDPCFVPASTSSHLHGGSFEWDFIVDEMAGRQIGIGFMLLWDLGPDWGFFGRP